MLFIIVFILSLSTFCFEVLLTRAFSISQWNHLAFMVISLVVFGFALGGVVLNIALIRIKDWAIKFARVEFLNALVVLYTVSGVGAFLVVNEMPIDYFRIPVEPIQFVYLFSSYLCLSIPFLITGFIISLAYAIRGEKSGVIYLGSMGGSACGAILPLFLLPLMGEGRLIVLAAVCPLLTLPFLNIRHFRKGTLKAWVMVLAPVLLAVVFMAWLQAGGNLVHVRPSEYKSLSQALLYPDTGLKHTSRGIRGRIDHVAGPYIRFFPGLSLKFTGSLPRQDALFRDGDNMVILNSLPHKKALKYPFSHLNHLGYRMMTRPGQVLIVQHNGDLGIPGAMAAGAAGIHAVIPNPEIANSVRNHYKIPVIADTPRAFLAASRDKYDVIHIENWGHSIIGSAALNQEYDYTVDAFADYLNHLKDSGVIIISRRLLLPPSDSVRMWATAFESLRKTGAAHPEQHILVFRNWDTYTMLVSNVPFSNQEDLFSFAEKLNFDIVFASDPKAYTPNRFHQYDAPYYYDALNRVAKAFQANSQEDHFKDYLLDVRPQTDDRPFPSRFLKWSRLTELYQATGGRFYTLFMSGEIVIGVVLLQALLVSSVLLFLPYYLNRKAKKTPAWWVGVYFISLGLGFMFVEFFYFKTLVRIFNEPVISFILVTGGIMMFSGLGGFISPFLRERSFRIMLMALTTGLLVLFFSHGYLTQMMLKCSEIQRFIFSILLLAPLGFLMGFPLPMGMKLLSQKPHQSAFAWATNGCASVIASVLSAQFAISLGISALLVLGILSYLSVFLSFGKMMR